MINILPKRYDKYDCYANNIIAPVSEFWGVCYLPVFWAEFNFVNKNHSPQTIEDISIIIDSKKIRTDIWREYCGIALNTYRCENIIEFKEIISKNLAENSPVGITLDSNFVPWHQYLQIRPHCFLICDMNRQKNEILCCDGDFHEEGMCGINLEYLFNHYHDIFLFKRKEIKRKSFEEALKYFECVIEKTNPCKSKDIKTLIACLKNCWNSCDKTVLMQNIASSDFLLDLTEICNSRHNFVKGIQYFYQEYGTKLFISSVEELSEIKDNWDSFKALFIKAVLSSEKRFIEKAINLLIQIEEKERIATKNLLYLIKKVREKYNENYVELFRN